MMLSKGTARENNTNNTNNEPKSLFITHVDAFGPYLQISGQLNPDAMTVVRNKMQQILPKCFVIDAAWDIGRQLTVLRGGVLAIHKIVKGAAPDDNDLLRAKILKVNTERISGRSALQVQVEYIDYGYNAEVSSYDLLFPEYDVMQQIPSLGSQYILLGICKDWTREEVNEIKDMIIHKVTDICIEMEFDSLKFISMKWKGFDFSEYLIHHRNMGAPIPNNLLRDNFSKLLKLQTPSTITTNISSNNNNNNNYDFRAPHVGNNSNNNNNNHIKTPYHVNNKQPVSVQNYVQPTPLLSKRSLQTRLQRYQHPQQVNTDPTMNFVKPCMPHTIGNLRSMSQGVHMMNSRSYTGHNYPQPALQQIPVGVPPFGLPLNGVGYPQNSAVSGRINTFQVAGRQQMPMLVTPLMDGLGRGDQMTAPTAASTPTPIRSATFKSNNLTMGKTYDVCVSFVENGPCLFSVQLVSAQEQLTEMMNHIEGVDFRPLSDKPVQGTACIARYSEDSQLYRAMITNSHPTACKVAYIDYGNAEMVESRNLYEITDEFLQAKVFSIRFTLSGHKELDPIDDSLKKTFKDLVMYQNCKLKVMPLEGPPLVQYCELYLHDQNVLEVLKQVQKCRLVYPKAVSLENSDVVEIRYTDSPKCFYVQKLSNSSKFQNLMDEMFLYYNKNQKVPTKLKLGAPCMVKNKNEWYRAEILRADSITTTVRFVDFGYEKNVTQNVISIIAEDHLKMPRQVVQCCLKGFENSELNMNLATSQMEMLAESSDEQRRRFTIKVFRIQPDGVHLVNLFTKDLNLMKKLYKLSMPFEQYLSLEKEDFNMSYNKAKHIKSVDSSPNTPSITSSNDVASSQQKQQKHPKGYANQQQQQQHQTDKQRQLRNFNNQNDWERNSSVGSGDQRDRDSRSNSSDYKRGKQNDSKEQQQQYRPQQQPQKENTQNFNGSQGGSDRRSTASTTSSNFSKARNGVQNYMQSPPRSTNNNKQDTRRQTMKQQASPQHQKNQRSQNAPQGYSQQSPSKGGGSTSSRSCDQNSVVTLATEENSNEHQAIEYVPLDHVFPVQPIGCPTHEEVIISWWVSPHQFYTHLKKRIPEFDRLMRDMQKFYKRKTWQQLQVKVGSNVIVRYRKDNTLYRARIVSCNQMLRKYKTYFVDFGYQYMVMADDIWQVEKRFAEFPCMAYLCSFKGIVSNFDHLSLIDRMDKYLPNGAALVCDYRAREDEMYYVDVSVNKKSLKEILTADGIITEVRPELRLSLLAGQQIRARFGSIKDMLNFKIRIEAFGEQVQFLCSYDDVRYVKSNAEIAQKFKSFYEGKSFVINIKDVNDNKVILLRPMLPLLKNENSINICTYPIIFESFDIRVVHVTNHYRLYGHCVEKEDEIAGLLGEMHDHYEETNVSPLGSIEAEQVCAAKSADSNWYRARILGKPQKDNQVADTVNVYFIDYGNDETVSKANVKPLHKKFYANKSAYAIEVNMPLRPLMSESQKGKSKKPSPLEAESLTAKSELEKIVLDQIVTCKAIEVRHNHLIADVKLESQKNVIDLMREKKLIKGRDVDYMRKLLDKEKPNMIEYIETVDLTLEDEEEVVAEKKQNNKSKNASPKKKKSPKAEEKTERKENSQIPIEVAAPKSPIKNVESPVKKKEDPQKLPETVPSIHLTKPATSLVSLPEKQIEVVAEPEPEPEPELIVDPYADMEHAVLSHCDNPAQFFVHPQHKLEELRKLQEDLQIVASSLPPLMRVINGAHCISLYSVDKQWYRAQILDAELMVLKFIDYGNTDCVSDTTDVKEMSVFPDIESLCMPCALPIKPNGTADWVDAANAIFNDSYKKVLHFEYITRGDNQKRSFIKLFIEGVNIAEKLIEDGFAKPLVVVDSGENCYISHLNGITDFYIQYEKDSKALELIEIHLSQNEKFPKLEKFEHSKIVAALFPDDAMWYRAKLLKKIPDKGYEVQFIDYGNTSISPECREISEDIATLPPLSKKCALELPDDCLAWSEAAEEKFAEISATGETIFTVDLCEPAADHALVHLFIDAHNVNDDLEPLCEHKPVEVDMNASFCNTTLQTSIFEFGVHYDARVSHVGTPNDFYIQFEKDSIRHEDMTSTLNTLGMEPLLNPQVGDLCASIFHEDNTFYRARIVSLTNDPNEYRVRFVDFGNETLSKNIRILPQDLIELKEFSKRCRLEGPVPENEATTQTFNEIIQDCQGVVKVEFVSDNDEDNDEPAIVRLFVPATSEDIAAKIVNETKADNAVSTNSCRISHAISPTNFYIQSMTNASKIEFIARSLQKDEVEKLSKLPQHTTGLLCCAYCKEDDLYYRGRIDTVVDDGVHVFLVDYGYSITSSEIRGLTSELRSIPPLAWKCKLKDLPEASELQLETQFAALLEAHFGETFEIESDDFDSDAGIHTVRLQVNYKDLSEVLAELVSKGDKQDDLISPLPKLLDCSVIHVNSPKSFYVQLSMNTQQVQQITDVLLDAESDFQPFTDLKVGAICAAQFPDDSAFYRAQIVQVLDDGKCEVHYLDFGNNSVTDQFRALPVSILDTEELAKHCSLEGNLNSPEACAQFEAFIDAHFSETFQLELLKTSSDPQICRLFHQDKNVADEVMKMLKNQSGAGDVTASASGHDDSKEESK